jgi:hypothetical protein
MAVLAIPFVIDAIAVAALSYFAAPGREGREKSLQEAGKALFGSDAQQQAGAMMSDANDEAPKSAKRSNPAEACSNCEPPEDDEEDSSKDSKRMSHKELDKAAKKNGFQDAHEFKRELGYDSKTDIFVDKKGNMYAGPRQGTGKLESLHYNIKGN